MSSISVRQMLEGILKGVITAREREAFEAMWDALHRFGALSPKQTAWIEKVYYKLPKDKPKSASFKSADVTTRVRAHSFDQFKKLCPSATKSELDRVKKFFAVNEGFITVSPIQ